MADFDPDVYFRAEQSWSEPQLLSLLCFMAAQEYT